MKLVVLVLISLLQLAVSFNTTSIKDLVQVTSSEYFKQLQNEGVSELCRAALGSASFSTLIQLFDASSKVPSGILNVDMFDLGNFDECYKLSEEISGATIYGKYCLSTIQIDPSILFNDTKSTRMLGKHNMGLHLAYCLLSPCTTEDFASIFKWTSFDNQYCYSQDSDPKLDASDCTAIIIFSIFTLLVILSTTYDILLYYTKKEAPHQILLAFSLWSNGRKILKTTTPSGGQLSCINGFKALSMMWVIYGHENSILLNSGAVNYLDISSFMKDKKNMYVLAAQVSVDTFFSIAGLLTVYTVLKAKVEGMTFVRNLPMFYVHRYLRLTPAFAFVILFNATLLKFIGSGPFWGNVQEDIDNCREGWWGSMLYIQNYIDPLSTCVPQSWYLYVDTQLFAVSPLVIIPLLFWPTIGLAFLGLLILAGFVIPFAVTYDLDLSVAQIDMDTSLRYMKYYYTQPYTRCGPYFIGMLFGWLIYKLKTDGIVVSKKTMHKMSIVLWPVSLAGTAACLYAGGDLVTGVNTDILDTSFYNGFNRNCWALSCCIIIMLCSIGYGGPINAFLSIPLFQILAKLSYSMYLVHFTIVITARFMSIRAPTYFSFWTLIHSFFGDFMLTLVGSFFLCAIFESPVMIIEKFIFGNDNRPKTQKKSPDESKI